jgi:hypothetical protein
MQSLEMTAVVRQNDSAQGVRPCQDFRVLCAVSAVVVRRQDVVP